MNPTSPPDLSKRPRDLVDKQEVEKYEFENFQTIEKNYILFFPYVLQSSLFDGIISLIPFVGGGGGGCRRGAYIQYDGRPSAVLPGCLPGQSDSMTASVSV